MAKYPIKLLKDENNTPFVPLVSTDCIRDKDNQTLQEILNKKLSPANLLGGEYVNVTTEGDNCYISVDLPNSLKLINNLTTAEAGQGALDASQGKILKDSIPTIIDDLTSTDKTKVLSANQGYVLNNKFNNYLPKTGTAELSKGLVPKAVVGSDAGNSAGWYKVCTQTMSGYGNTNILYYIKDGYQTGAVGLLDLEMRSSNTNIGIWQCCWLSRKGFKKDDIRIVVSGMTWTLYIRRTIGQYGRISFTEIYNRNINGTNPYAITYYNSTTPETTAPTATGQSNDNTAQFLDNIYPIGSIYLSVNNVNPSTYLGGTWELIKDKFLVGAGNTYAGGATGGSTTHTHTTGNHTLTVAEMPGHTHNYDDGMRYYAEGSATGGDIIAEITTTGKKYIHTTTSTGGSGAHNHGNTGSSSNVPPYLAVYMWKRTA